MKICSKCKIEKTLTEFNKDKSKRDGLQDRCRPCQGSASKKYNEANREQIHAALKNWKKKNPHKVMAQRALRRARELKATPPWLNAEQKMLIENYYMKAAQLSIQTGIKHHVDHIFPLKGKNFSGLHLPWNLCVIPAFENKSKINKFPVEYTEYSW